MRLSVLSSLTLFLLLQESDGYWCDLPYLNSEDFLDSTFESIHHNTMSLWPTCEGVPCCVTNKICDKYLGCFEQGSNTIWCHQGKLPWSPEKIHPQFWVFGPGGKKWYIGYDALEITVKELALDTSRELWFLIHGFGGDWPKPWMYPMKDALLAKARNSGMLCSSVPRVLPQFILVTNLRIP